MNIDMFVWYLKEHLLEVRQTFAHVNNLQKKHTIGNKTKPLGFQMVRPKSKQLGVTRFEYLVVLISTYVTTSKRIGWSSYWKQMQMQERVVVHNNIPRMWG